MAGIIKDHRTKDLEAPLTWAVATDKFMSGWGQAPDTSYVAYPIYSYEDERELMQYTGLIPLLTTEEPPETSYGCDCEECLVTDCDGACWAEAA